MFWVKNRYAKIWKIFDSKEKYVDLSIGTSEKTQENTYINSRWPARAIGKAFNQIKKGDIEEGEQYSIIKGRLSNERYKDDDGNWKSALRLVVMEFGAAGADEGDDDDDDRPEKPAAKSSTQRKTASNKPATKKPESEEEEDPWG